MLTNLLPILIRTDIPELDLEAGAVELAPKALPYLEPTEVPNEPGRSEGCSASAAQSASLGWIAACIVAMWLGRRHIVR
jgi:hypothetical protein